MLKTIANISIFTIAVMLYACAGQSKDESYNAAPTESMEEEKSAPVTPIEGLELEQFPDSLSEEQQNAYQLRAIQKFQDFMDYVNILSKPNIDEDLKAHSEEQLTQLFIDDSVQLFAPDSSLHDFINGISNNKTPILYQTNAANFSSPLAKDTLRLYKGTLNISWKPVTDSSLSQVDVYLIEVVKAFGESEHKTVEIRLGNIH